jgi:hemerythrin
VLRWVPGSRSPLPESGEVPLPSGRTPARGLPPTGRFQLAAPVQRLRALLGASIARPVRDHAGEGAESGVEERSPAFPGARARQVVRTPGDDERAVPPRSRRDPDAGPGGQAGRLRRGEALERARREEALTAPIGPPRSSGVRILDGDLTDRRVSGGGQAWIGRAGGGDRTRPDPDDEDEPVDDHRRQLLTSVLALGGLGLTGLVASRMSDDSGGASTTAASAVAGTTAGTDPGTGTGPDTGMDGTPANGGWPVTSTGSRRVPVVLGNGELDSQLKRLFELVDQLDDVVRSGRSRRRQAMVLADLVAWTKVHFTFEESLMDNYGLSGSAAHKAHHRAFFSQFFGTFVKKFTAGTADLTPELIGKLRSWLEDHMVHDDLALVNGLRARGVPSAV